MHGKRCGEFGVLRRSALGGVRLWPLACMHMCRRKCCVSGLLASVLVHHTCHTCIGVSDVKGPHHATLGRVEVDVVGEGIRDGGAEEEDAGERGEQRVAVPAAGNEVVGREVERRVVRDVLAVVLHAYVLP